jgi:O-antigen/teichoic acid export membrane protein
VRAFLQNKYRSLTADKGFSEILTGTAWAMASRVGTLVLSLASSLIIARLYGAEAMGILAIVISVIGIVTVFSVMGTGVSILRMIPEHLVQHSPSSAFRVYRKTQYLVAGVSVVIGVMLYFLSGQIADGVFKKPEMQGVIAVASMFVVFCAILQLNQQAVRGLKLIRTFSLLQLLPSVCFVLFLVVGLKWESLHVPAYAQLAAWGVSGILGVIVMDRAFRRRMKKTDKICEVPVRSILSLSLPMLATSAMQIVIGQTGVIVLGMYKSAEEVGYYALAVRLATLTSFVLNAINTMSAPAFSELFSQGQTGELLRIARKSTQLIVWTTSPILIVLLVFGQSILALFRPEFAVAYPALAILVIGQFIHSISGSTGLFMSMTGHQNSLRNIMTIAAAINVVLTFALTPHLGLIGPAIASSASTIFWNAAALMLIQRRFGGTIAYVPFRVR